MALLRLMLAVANCMCGPARCINKVLDMALFVLQLMCGLVLRCGDSNNSQKVPSMAWLRCMAVDSVFMVHAETACAHAMLGVDYCL
jgi:hypothetical protein